MKLGDKETSDRFWLSIDSFLIAVANISKILWPSRPPKCDRCKFWPELPPKVLEERQSQNILSIDDSSPIASRKFRNYFEHYDFKIEELSKGTHHNTILFDSNVITGDPNNLPSYGFPSIVCRSIRNFGSDKFILYFGEEKYHINEVGRAIQDISDKIKCFPQSKLIFSKTEGWKSFVDKCTSAYRQK